MFKIEMLPAGYGDSILVEYGTNQASNKVLIDAGPYFAFDELARRFKTLIEAKTSLELFVVTHVDCDHIDGAITLLNADQTKLKIKQVWFNNYDNLSDELGAPEGDILSALIIEKKIPWNIAFGRKSISLINSKQLKEVTLDGGLHLTLLSPTRTELEKLKPDWEKAARKAHITPGSREDALKLLKKKGKKYEPPPDLLGEETPNINALLQEPYSSRTTTTNRSSIAFIAEFDGKSCLFTGDSSPAVVSASIRTLLKKRKTTKLKLDAVKVSHHGSRENTSSTLLKMLDCKKFLVSTNGKSYSHPHPESIARIIELCGPNTQLIFNYSSPQNKIWNNEYLQNEHHFTTVYPQKNDEGIVVSL
jgi:beta-lactamase superfamily II metal-dependent hydrolase